MRTYTALLNAERRSPVLVRDGFSVGALVFGAFWLLFHRAWIAGVLALCLTIAIGVISRSDTATVLQVALAWTLGLFGNDLRRWSLERQGYRIAHVVQASDEIAALGRLLDHRPDLIAEAAR